jgi:gas vesicle protein
MADRKIAALGIFAAGAGIGAVAALLLAPRTGKQTRRRIRNTANEALNRIEDVREDLRNRMTDWAEEASDAIVSGLTCGKVAAREGGEQVTQALERVKEAMEDGRQRVERYVRSVAG